MQKVKRNSSFELLRIISCIMIIILHYLNGSMGGALSNVVKGSTNYYVCHFIESFCIISVNCFILISGYFMINKKEININKIIKLLLTLLFYGVIMFFIAIVFKIKPFSKKELLLSVLPFFGGRRWFISTYIILFLFIPYLNKIFVSLSKKQYLLFLIIYIILFSIWPTFLFNPPVTDNGYGIINFILLYALGGYIKLHLNLKYIQNKYLWLLIYLIFTIITTIFSTFTFRAWNYNSFFNIISSVALFIYFTKVNIKSKFINILSGLSFGIFISHSDPMLRDKFYSIMRCSDYYSSSYLIVHLIICCLLSYMIFGIIEYIRTFVFSYTIDKAVDKIKIFNYEIKVE